MKPHLKIYLLLIILISNISILKSQPTTWQRVLTYTNNSVFHKTQQTSDGGFIAVGENRIGIYSKIFLVKFNVFGDTIYTRYFNINVNSGYIGFWIEETNDKGFIICGYGDGVNGDAYLIKTDSLGIIIWYKTYGGLGQDVGCCVKQTNDGGFILAIRTSSYGSTIDIMLVKTDSLGNQIWSKVYTNSNSNDFVQEVNIVGNSGYILVGTNSVIGDSANIYIMRTNISGDTLWTKKIGGQRTSAGYSIDSIAKNGFIICGVSSSFNTNYYFQSYVAKIDSSGNLIWERCYFSNYHETAFSIKNINNNEYVFCGTSDSVKAYYERAFIRKIDQSGNVLKEKFYRGGDESNQFSSIDLTNDNGYILCGYATFKTSALYSYIVKTDSLGNISTNIKLNNSFIPNTYELFQNYPNPFNSTTLIRYKLPIFSNVKLTIFDLLGKVVFILINKHQQAGNYEIEFNSNLIKDRISSGFYFYSMESANFFETKKMVILK